MLSVLTCRADVDRYINEHYECLGFKPLAIAMYDEFMDAMIEELKLSAIYSTKKKEKLMKYKDIPIVRLGVWRNVRT